MNVDDRTIEEIIELVESYMDYELDVPYCYGEPDIEIYLSIKESDRKIVREKIKEILE